MDAGLSNKLANNFWLEQVTEKLQIYLESWIIEDSRYVRSFAVTLPVQELLRPKVNSGILIRIRYIIFVNYP